MWKILQDVLLVELVPMCSLYTTSLITSCVNRIEIASSNGTVISNCAQKIVQVFLYFSTSEGSVQRTKEFKEKGPAFKEKRMVKYCLPLC